MNAPLHQSIEVATKQPAKLGGLPVRTDLRAGLAWDEIDDQAISLWNQLTDAVSTAAQSVSDAVQGLIPS
ncbi:MAG: hypothetical protein R3C14_42940 [Caldilineaceae bacterium]